MFVKFRTIVALSAAVMTTVPALAEDVTIRFAHQFPENHYLWQAGGKVFVERLTDQIDGRVDLSVFPAAQLGKDPLAVLQSGLADIVTLVPSYSPEKMPLTSVSELPGFHHTTCEGVNRLWQIAQAGAPLDEAEYGPMGIHVLFVAHQPTYKLLLAKAKVEKLSDVAGLKIRANGASIGSLVRNVGGVAISMTSGEVYDSMQRGTIDGTLLPYNSLRIYSLDTVTTHVYEGLEFGGGPVLYAMTSKAWNALSDDAKAQFTKAAAEAQQNLCTFQDEMEIKDRTNIVAAGEIEIVTADDADQAEWQVKFDEVAVLWAEGMEAQGRPGRAILDAFRAASK